MNKTVTVKVDGSLSDEIYNAGTMYEHNATTLVFEIDAQYISPQYRYYIEFALPTGVVRTEYLTPNESNKISFDLPASLTSSMSMLCYFNVVEINETTYETEKLIKAKEIKLCFSPIVACDDALREEYDFSVNSLLEAVKNGDFKGEKGETGDKGDKGDKGEKGDTGPAVAVDTEMSDISENPVQNKAVKKYVDDKTEKVSGRLIYYTALQESVRSIKITQDQDGNSFALSEIYLIISIPASPELNSFAYIANSLHTVSNKTLYNFYGRTAIKGGISGKNHLQIHNAKINNNRWEFMIGTALNTSAKYNSSMVDCISDNIGYVPNTYHLSDDRLLADGITLSPTGSTNVFPVGTEIEVYGR